MLSRIEVQGPESVTFLSTGGGLVEGCDVRGRPCLGLEFGVGIFSFVVAFKVVRLQPRRVRQPYLSVGTPLPPTHRLTK
jgi:hypothetical protein